MASEHFGQLVIGPPGAGKSTYCTGMYDLLTSLGRDVRIINLDPACSPQLPYPCAIDIRSLITLQDAMDCYGLGPNGGIIYAMEYLATNLDWLRAAMARLPAAAYLLFDFPGQVELYTCSSALDTVYQYLQSLSSHLTAVHLIDSYHLHSPSTFLSAVLLSLSSMCRLSLPHVNVISKIDAAETMGELPLPLSFYTDGLELGYLLQHIKAELSHGTNKARADEDREEERRGKRALTATTASAQQGTADEDGEEEEEYVQFESGELSEDDEDESGGAASTSGIEPRFLRLSELLCELVDSYSLVSFATLSIHDKRSVLQLLRTIDTSNGYIFTNTDKEYEMTVAKQRYEQQQQQQHQQYSQQRQDVGSAHRRPTSTVTPGGYSMFNLVNTAESQPSPLPQSVLTEPNTGLRSIVASLCVVLANCCHLCHLVLCRLTIHERSGTAAPT